MQVFLQKLHRRLLSSFLGNAALLAAPGFVLAIVADHLPGTGDGVEFKAAAGEVLAGGRRLPHTTVQYDEKSNDLVFNFFNVELADNLKENMIVKSPGLRHVKEVRFEQLSGWLGDNQSGSQMPIVRLRITLEGRPLYNARASYSDGTGYEETDRCTVIFR